MSFFTNVIKQEEQFDGILSSTVLLERKAKIHLRNPITIVKKKAKSAFLYF